MAFDPAKSSLIHFCRTRTGRTETVKLGRDAIAPLDSTRFLGVILERGSPPTRSMWWTDCALKSSPLAASPRKPGVRQHCAHSQCTQQSFAVS